MPSVEKTIDIHVPVTVAFNHWANFEAFPRFMEGVQEVTWLDDRHVHWKASIYGKHEEWDAEVTETSPNQRIAWRSVHGPEHTGLVTFEPLDAGRTRVTLRMVYEPSGLLERAGDMLGLVDRRVDGDLQRFKEFVETHAAELRPPRTGTGTF